MVARRSREHGFDDHGVQAGVDVIGGDFTAVGGGGRQSLVEIDGSDESELRQVVVVGSDAWEVLAVGVGYGLEHFLLRHRNALRRRTREGKDGIF